LVETKTINDHNVINNPASVIRFPYDNHLGSACLELDTAGYVISYEEYHPFGTSSFREKNSSIEVSLKRYKYVGKERDEESGLYYYGARYYAAWLGRFVSVDPLQHKYPHYTPYQYAGNKPISYIDLDGREEKKEENGSTPSSNANYWKYDKDNNEIKYIGSNSSKNEENTKNYILKEGGTVTSVTPENYQDVQSQFSLFPDQSTVKLINDQFNEMKKSQKFNQQVYDNNIPIGRYSGTFFEKGGFMASKGDEILPIRAIDGKVSFDIANPPGVNSTISKDPKYNASTLKGKGYSINVIWHLHASAKPAENNISGEILGGTSRTQLWGQFPSQGNNSDLSTATEYKQAGYNATLIQISTQGKGEVHFYDEKGTYLTLPMNTFIRPLPKKK